MRYRTTLTRLLLMDLEISRGQHIDDMLREIIEESNAQEWEVYDEVWD